MSAEGAVLAAVSYEDKFGPLGTIAVVAGQLDDAQTLVIETWVMSCRAFARRIEHQTLKMLFDTTGASQIEFRFTPTAKNGPTARVLRDAPGRGAAVRVSPFAPAVRGEVSAAVS